MSESLQVWLYDDHVADIRGTRTGGITFAYTRRAVERWEGNLPVVSCSLPVRTGRTTAGRAFFRGLLPEGDALRAMAAAAGTTGMDTFTMLRRFGRDVAGALVIGDGPPADRPGSIEPYDEGTLTADVLGLADSPLALKDDSELSVAGLQNKLLLVRTADGWARPRHGFPSTHILKVEDRRFPGLVTHEAAALRLAASIGLSRVTPAVVEFGPVACLVVDRFDRAQGRRLHQEDICQALAVMPDSARGLGKYESAGGPGFAAVADLLDRHAHDPLRELRRLLQAAVYTVVIGNADAHGKNLALLHTAPGVVELAPLYDTVPTALFPSLRADAAMSVNGRRRLLDITGADLVAEAGRWRVAPLQARAVVEATAEQVLAALDDARPTPELADLVSRRARAILESLPRVS